MLIVFTTRYRKIGILGGMGPEATIDLYRRIIQIFQREYDSIYDSDFPEIIICNLPIPDVVEGAIEEDKIKDVLVRGIKQLETIGVDFIAIPCNTISYYFPEMEKAAVVPLLNILEETAKEVQKLGLKRVGLLGTEMTIDTGIYDLILKNREIVNPGKNQRKTITRIILNILAGNKCRDDQQRLQRIANELKEKGAQKVILGCTELPLLVNGEDLLNTTQILARAVVEKCMEETNETENNE